MTLNLDAPETRLALKAVRRAADLAGQVQKELVLASSTATITKDDLSPVTVADYAVQALVAHQLLQAFPNDDLVAEEGTASLRAAECGPTLDAVVSFVGRHLAGAARENVCEWIDRGGATPNGRFWVLDPIDGTKGFLRGDQYAIALALIENGVVQLGVLGCPNLNTDGTPNVGGVGALAVAVRGQGSWIAPLNQPEQWTPLRVSATATLAESRILRSFETRHTNVMQIENFMRVNGLTQPPVLMDSQVKYVVLAAGRGEVLFRLPPPDKLNYREKIWDQAAGLIVVEEAGGRVTDARGAALDFKHGRALERNSGVIASNGVLHTAVVQALSALVG